jgi:DNA-binding transcriptional regulator LsrR (DeoR family)
VAGGARKYGAIRGAVLGRWVNILITDRVTATRLLREEPA